MILQSFQVTPLRSPTDHWNTADRLCSEMPSLIRVVQALNRYITAIPARIIVAADVFLREETMMMTAAGISEKKNAVVMRPRLPMVPVTVIPNPRARVAPKDAPDDIPVVYGSARGFFIMLCMAAPATPRQHPTMSPPTILGRRMSNTAQSMSTSHLEGSTKWYHMSR